MMWGSAWKTDGANAQNHLLRPAGSVRLLIERLAARMVEEQWPAITRITEALAAEGELSGARIEALMG
jgi:hypothetical protein